MHRKSRLISKLKLLNELLKEMKYEACQEVCQLFVTKLPPEFFCQTSFWQNDLVLLVDIES